MAELTVTKDNFETAVMQSAQPVLLDFWAPWCSPCRMLSPVVADIEQEYEGKLTVGKVNVDEETALAGAFQVSGIPMLVVLHQGKVVNGAVGYQSKEQIKTLLEGTV